MKKIKDYNWYKEDCLNRTTKINLYLVMSFPIPAGIYEYYCDDNNNIYSTIRIDESKCICGHFHIFGNDGTCQYFWEKLKTDIEKMTKDFTEYNNDIIITETGYKLVYKYLSLENAEERRGL